MRELLSTFLWFILVLAILCLIVLILFSKGYIN